MFGRWTNLNERNMERSKVQGPQPNFSDFGSFEVKYGLQISDSIPPDSLILWLPCFLSFLLSLTFDLLCCLLCRCPVLADMYTGHKEATEDRREVHPKVTASFRQKNIEASVPTSTKVIAVKALRAVVLRQLKSVSAIRVIEYHRRNLIF